MKEQEDELFRNWKDLTTAGTVADVYNYLTRSGPQSQHPWVWLDEARLQHRGPGSGSGPPRPRIGGGGGVGRGLPPLHGR